MNKSKIKTKLPDGQETVEQNIIIDALKKAKYLPLPLNPAQDFSLGILLYAVKTPTGTSILSSTGKIALLQARKGLPSVACGLEFRPVKMDDECLERFSYAGITDFLDGKSNIRAVQVYDEIRTYLTDYFYLHDEAVSKYLALWLMGTYVHQMFFGFPYIHFNAPKGCGKSHLMYLMQTIAFNGQSSIDTTGANLYREIDAHSCTIFLDEVEQYTGKTKDVERNSSNMAIINSGNRKGGIIKRQEKISGVFVTVKYRAYAPKCFGGINEITPTMRSRSVGIRLQKRLLSEKTKAYRPNDALKEREQTIRDHCYQFALQYAQEINQFTESEPSVLWSLAGLYDRELEIWFPILVMAQLVDECKGNNAVGQEMIAMQKISTTKKTEADLTDDPIMRAISGLDGLLDENKDETKFSCAEVAIYFKENVEELHWLDLEKGAAITVGKWLSTLEFRKDVIKKRRVVVITREQVDLLMKRYGLTKSNPETNAETSSNDDLFPVDRKRVQVGKMTTCFEQPVSGNFKRRKPKKAGKRIQVTNQKIKEKKRKN
jgi:hypothetical protein